MKRKVDKQEIITIAVIFLVLAVCVILPSDTGEKNVIDTIDNNVTIQINEGENAISLLPGDADEIRKAPDAFPEFLTDDQKDLYAAAMEAYKHFYVSSGWDIDYEAPILEHYNGLSYLPDNGFSTYEDFRKCMDSIFTEGCTNFMLNKTQSYIDVNNILYTLPGDRGIDIYYQSTSFELVKQEKNEIIFNMICHYDDTEFALDYIPKGPYTEVKEIKMLNTENGWRFSQFYIPF